MTKKIILPKEELKELYALGLSMSKLAKHFGTTKRVIHLRMQEYAIKRRYPVTGSNHPMWKGGKVKKTGYWAIWNPTHPHANNVGYVKEHILVMEKALGRYIRQDEYIHHINCDRLDNRLENLWLTSSHSEHFTSHTSINKLIKPLLEQGIIGFKDGAYYLK